MNLLKKYFLTGIITTLVLGSCKKYVEVEPKGQITPTTVNDYQLLLNNNSIWNLTYGTIDFLTDDIALTDEGLLTKISAQAIYNIYQFSDYYYQPANDDPEWNLFYKQVFTANVILDGLQQLSESKQRSEIEAAAKVHRAYAYLCLVNLYAKHYDASAGTSPGVPLLLSPSSSQSLQRASVAQVYAQILSDLNTSIAFLPDLPLNKAAPSKAAAFALLARTNLYMGNYPSALDFSDRCLTLQSAILNLNNYSSAGSFPGFALPLGQDNPEVIFLKASQNQDAPLGLSSELLDILGTNDLRYKFYTYNGPDLGDAAGRYFAYFAPLEGRNEGPTVGEITLIRAECLARSQRGQDGMTAINNLRRFRIATKDYTPLVAPTDAQALQIILQERRRELFGRGFRLFDLKRLNLDPAMAKTVLHPFGKIILTLAPGSQKYIYPIPQNVVASNPEITQNPR